MVIIIYSSRLVEFLARVDLAVKPAFPEKNSYVPRGGDARRRNFPHASIRRINPKGKDHEKTKIKDITKFAQGANSPLPFEYRPNSVPCLGDKGENRATRFV
jgi:hypothetical protein